MRQLGCRFCYWCHPPSQKGHANLIPSTRAATCCCQHRAFISDFYGEYEGLSFFPFFWSPLLHPTMKSAYYYNNTVDEIGWVPSTFEWNTCVLRKLIVKVWVHSTFLPLSCCNCNLSLHLLEDSISNNDALQCSLRPLESSWGMHLYHFNGNWIWNSEMRSRKHWCLECLGVCVCW